MWVWGTQRRGGWVGGWVGEGRTGDELGGFFGGAGDDFLAPGGRAAGALVFLEEVEDVDL